MDKTIKIRSWRDDSIIFEYACPKNTLKKTIEQGVRKGIRFRWADLREVDLRWSKGIKMYWHIHHRMLVEALLEPLKNRINYIKTEKPKEEIPLRLKLLKKVKAKSADYPTTKAGWEKLHQKECGCGWSSKRQTIFTKENGWQGNKNG